MNEIVDKSTRFRQVFLEISVRHTNKFTLRPLSPFDGD